MIGTRPKGDGTFDYQLGMGAEEPWFPEADLELFDDRPRWSSVDEFLRDLVLVKLATPLADSLYAYRASRTQFEPYQFRPALKFLANPDQRILIADEVGLGKTIEASIIYLELKARLDISRALVLCPSRLKGKWQDELRNRFDEDFQDLDNGGIHQLLDDHRRLGGAHSFRAITSFELLRREQIVEKLIEHQIPLDLLIVDEAHYMRNAETRTFALGQILADNADAVVFLTATPLHLGNRDLYNLLHLLAPHEFNDPYLFEDQVRPNVHVNHAARQLAAGRPAEALQTLRTVERTTLSRRFLDNPYYRDIVERLQAGPADRRQRVELQRDLLELNTLASMFTRTRKREVANAAVRTAHTITVALSPAERTFYDGILERVRRDLARTSGGAPAFALVGRERMAASCLIAMRQAFEEGARQHVRPKSSLESSAFTLEEADDQSRLADRELLELSRRIGDADAKYDLFEQALGAALAGDPNSKALVFSFFRRTLDYLQRRLRASGYEVDVIHGGISIPERRRIMERFRQDPRIRVLLSSEVGAEGLDFEFCDVLVNYDLPWNPMQVEQRIGRLDRFGQTHERIRIYNFCIEDTIETRIFQRLYTRIRIFEESIGDLEAILGEEIRELSRSALQPNLTPRQQERLAEQAADRIVRRQQEAEALERQKDQLLGQDAILDQGVNETIRSGRYVSAAEVRALVGTYLQHRFPNVAFEGDTDEPCWTLHLHPDLTADIYQYLNSTRQPVRASEQFREAMFRHRAVALTFDSELARHRPNLELVTARHPLAGTARRFWESVTRTGVPASRIVLQGPAEEAGDGYFYIYVLEQYGTTTRLTLESSVVLDDGRPAPESSASLLAQLLTQTSIPRDLLYDSDDFLAAERHALGQIGRLRDELEAETRRRNEALVAARTASVQASFRAKIQRTQELLARADEERIRRMRQAQITNLEAKLQNKLRELDRTREVSVSYRLVGGGRVRIIPAAAAPASPRADAPAVAALPPTGMAPIQEPRPPRSPVAVGEAATPIRATTPETTAVTGSASIPHVQPIPPEEPAVPESVDGRGRSAGEPIHLRLSRDVGPEISDEGGAAPVPAPERSAGEEQATGSWSRLRRAFMRLFGQ